MKEMAIHTWFKNQAKKRYGENFSYIKSPAGIYSSRKGISDFICCIFGVFTAIEVKTEVGKITALQQHFLDEVNKAGGIGLCLKGKDVSIFDKIDEELSNFCKFDRFGNKIIIKEKSKPSIMMETDNKWSMHSKL